MNKNNEKIDEILNNLPIDKHIPKSFIKAISIINDDKYEKIMCSVSGGSDSDVIMDLICKVDFDKKVEFVWFDTKLEYEATKRHLEYLEKRYDREILRKEPIKSIPQSCRDHGQPFLNKYVSEMMSRLQRYNFKWEDKPFKVLLNKYCEEVDKVKATYPDGKVKNGISKIGSKYWKGCVVALKWWCNYHENSTNKKTGKVIISRFNIDRNKYLKEFIIENHPEFKISCLCCKYAKKNVANKVIKEEGYQLNITGVRKAEGGVRQTAYKTCYDGDKNYRVILWYDDESKSNYNEHYDIVNSDCYTVYGLKRTGCVGCPFGKDYQLELMTAKRYEPNLYKAASNIFKDSYMYTDKYYYYRYTRKLQEKGYVISSIQEENYIKKSSFQDKLF